MKVLGLISGTSHDGIDAAVVDFSLAGDRLHGVVAHHGVTPYDTELRARLRAALPPAATDLAEICALDTLIGRTFADVAAGAIDRCGGVDAIASHGQTVFHWVEGSHALGTLQLGQAAWIAERTGVPVVSDVRIRDITAGGHGAPLVPILDVLLLGDRPGVSAALNLGGISNITIIAGGVAQTAYDIGPANALLDAVAVDATGSVDSFDDGGRLAASGTVDDVLLAELLADPYYALPAPRSTGKEHFHLEYVKAAMHRAGRSPATADLLATLTELTATTVAEEVRAAGIESLVVSGGGCRNPFLLGRLEAALPGVALMRSDELGAPADTKEAIAFALIGWCTMHGVPGNVPAATGACGPRLLGTITPGHGPLVLPTAVETPITGLTLRAR